MASCLESLELSVLFNFFSPSLVLFIKKSDGHGSDKAGFNTGLSLFNQNNFSFLSQYKFIFY